MPAVIRKLVSKIGQVLGAVMKVAAEEWQLGAPSSTLKRR